MLQLKLYRQHIFDQCLMSIIALLYTFLAYDVTKTINHHSIVLLHQFAVLRVFRKKYIYIGANNLPIRHTESLKF